MVEGVLESLEDLNVFKWEPKKLVADQFTKSMEDNRKFLEVSKEIVVELDADTNSVNTTISKIESNADDSSLDFSLTKLKIVSESKDDIIITCDSSLSINSDITYNSESALAPSAGSSDLESQEVSNYSMKSAIKAMIIGSPDQITDSNTEVAKKSKNK